MWKQNITLSMVRPAINDAIGDAYTKLDDAEFDKITNIAYELSNKLSLNMVEGINLVGQIGMTLAASGPVRESALLDSYNIIDDET